MNGSMAIVVLSVLAITGCSERQIAQANEQAAKAQQQTVVVASVDSQRLSTNLSLPAQVTAYQMVNVYPKVTGFIEQIRVDRGSHVKAGEMIARLSAPEMVAQKSQAEARFRATQAQLAAAKAKLASNSGTFEHLAVAAKVPGVVAANDVAVAEQTVVADRAQVEAASNEVKAAEDALRSVSQLEEYLIVRAPFDGVVTERNFHPGALVGPSSGQAGSPPIVRIEQVNRLRLTVPVPEAYVAGLTEGLQVAFTIPAYPGRKFHAPIARISQSVDQTTRTMAVELDIRNAANEITPGSFASVEWPIHRTYEALVVPASAIATDLQRTFVIRIHDGKAEWVDVKTGLTADGKTEVFGQLQSGDMVVRNATDAIRPGTPVKAAM
jgi:membrane fusion protein (multidrug efflux system)